MKIRYQIQIADSLGFDFGGNPDSAFVCKGDAINRALALRSILDNHADRRAVRVIDTGKHRCPEVYRSESPLA